MTKNITMYFLNFVYVLNKEVNLVIGGHAIKANKTKKAPYTA